MIEAVVDADRLPLGAAAVGNRVAPLAVAAHPPATASAASPTRSIGVFAPLGIDGARFARLTRGRCVTIVEWLAVAVAGGSRRTVVVEKSLGTTAVGFEAFAPFGAGVGRWFAVAAAAATAASTAPPATGAIFLAPFAFGPRGTLDVTVHNRPRSIGPSFGAFLASLVAPFRGPRWRPLDWPRPRSSGFGSADTKIGG